MTWVGLRWSTVSNKGGLCWLVSATVFDESGARTGRLRRYIFKGCTSPKRHPLIVLIFQLHLSHLSQLHLYHLPAEMGQLNGEMCRLAHCTVSSTQSPPPLHQCHCCLPLCCTASHSHAQLWPTRLISQLCFTNSIKLKTAHAVSDTEITISSKTSGIHFLFCKIKTPDNK